MIPDELAYKVRDAVTRRVLGSVDEAFVLSLNDVGEDDAGRPRRFVMAGRLIVVATYRLILEEQLMYPLQPTVERLSIA